MTSQTTFTSCMHDQMLESNRDDVKLEAMRCVTVMTAKGKLSVPRTLFPHIVKNVSSKNPELKKLIYLYLTNFADQEPDLALLPVASLQKSLKSPNPLIRSSALKVLTSMRLNILSAILMATLRNSVNDLSPYVRKTVAHSIIKIYRLDSELKEDLIEYVERLFNDKNSMVLSSAVATFEVVCPERLDLVHKHYRRFCFVLADCNEWGQTVMLNLLKRYILKTCQRSKNGIVGSGDQDPKILLRSAKPLVHSNNSSVVMAVVKLYIAIATHNDVRSTITKPLLRLLYSHREIQLVVLTMIENLTTNTGHEGAIQEDNESGDENAIIKVPERDEISIKDENFNGDQISDDLNEQQSDRQQSINREPSPEADDAEPETSRDGYLPLDEGACETSHPEILNGESGSHSDKIDTNVDEKVPRNEEKEVETEEEEGDDENYDDESDGEGSDDEEEEDDEDESSEEDEDESSEEICLGDQKRMDNKNSESDKDDEIKTNENEANYIDISANKDPVAYCEVFRPYLKSFFVRHSDCTQSRLIKLRILTNLSSPVNVSQILRELQAYISTYVEDEDLVSAAIHAIGRCAITVKEVAPTCLNRLTSLLSNNNEHVVSEAIVVLRSQIINKKTTAKLSNESAAANSSDSKEDASGIENEVAPQQTDENDKMISTVIKQVTKLLPTVAAPQARATILWILAEFCDKNLTAAKCAPNVLRSIAKTFCQEDNFVKLQSLTLVSKFLLSLDKETKADLYDKIQLLASYLFSLAKYDINHDVRDRGRFLKKLLENEELCAKVLICESQEMQPELAA